MVTQSHNNITEPLQAMASYDALHFDRTAQRLINIMPLGVVAFDLQLNITDRNPRAKRMLAATDNIAEALAFGTETAMEPAWDELLHQALAEKKPRIFENVKYHHHSQNSVLHIICTPLTEENTDNLIGGILLMEDITNKVLMENDLAAAERLAAVGKLAARVAHELNNPLDGILRYINLAKRLAEQKEVNQIQHYLQESRKGLLRMVQIISELLEYSRSTYSTFEEADINKIVEDALKNMEGQTAAKDIKFIRQYQQPMPNIRSGNLYQVFCNLIKNAIDAMSQGGKLAVKTLCDDENMFIQFTDTGPGIPPETLARIFEPFYTTKKAGKGTGLGLAISKDIIERYNGKIQAENLPAGGCRFTVSIPLEHTSWKKADK